MRHLPVTRTKEPSCTVTELPDARPVFVDSGHGRVRTAVWQRDTRNAKSFVRNVNSRLITQHRFDHKLWLSSDA